MNLSFADAVNNRPVIPLPPPEADENGSLGFAIQEVKHFRPELVQGRVRAMLEGHTPLSDPVADNVSQNPADGVEADSFC
jgi:hypothetical protein